MAIATAPRRASEHNLTAWRSACALLAVLTAVAAPTQAESKFDIKLTGSETYIDNLRLVSPDEPSTSDFITQLNPEVTYTSNSPRLNAALHYLMQNLWYADNSEFNDTFHNLDASADWVAVPDWFHLIARGAYGQHLVNPQDVVNVGNLFATANVADYGAGSLNPVLKHTFGSTQLDIEYAYGFIDYHEPPQGTSSIAPFTLDDSVNQNGLFRFGSEDDAKIGWGVEYQNDFVDYDKALDYRYERAGATASYAFGPAFRLIAEGGNESDLEKSTSEGGLDSSYWRAGGTWKPDQQTSIEALVGERFFGNTYLVKLRRDSRLMKLSLSYTEEPTTESQTLVFAPGTTPGQLNEPPLGIDTTRISPRAYIADTFEGNLTLAGTRTEITLRLYSEDRRYLATPTEPEGNEKYQGGGLSLLRQLGPKSDLLISGATNKTSFIGGGFSRDNRADITLTRRFSPTFKSALQTSYLDRWGDGASDYKAWFSTLRLEKTF
jgi:hypothetical protein